MREEELKRKGYCITSLKYRIASRIDREDWQDICADPDQYRRCHSKDNIIVSACMLKKLKGSQLGYKKFRK